MSDKNKKIVLSRQSINQTSSSSSTSSNQRNFPALPLHPNRFSPIAPRPRPPYSVLAQSIPKPTQTILSKASTSTPNNPEYFINPNQQIIKILEPFEEQKLQKSFLTLLEYLYPTDSHFYTDEYKTREYYQAILVDSESVIIEHTFNQKNPDYIDCSKARILKVITPEEWATKPYTYKTLNYPSFPIYNYYDYQDAWFHAFLLRSFNHTWFFHFSEKFNKDYPRWFIKWFIYFGSIPTIFPQEVLKGFHKYKDYFMKDHVSPTEYTLQFSIIFKLPWIVQFTYKKQEARDTSPPLFYRQFSVKWWKRINDDQADVKAVNEYYKNFTRGKQTISTPTPKIQDEDFIKRLQACSSPEEIQDVINEIKRSPTPSEDLLQDAQDPYEDVILL